MARFALLMALCSVLTGAGNASAQPPAGGTLTYSWALPTGSDPNVVATTIDPTTGSLTALTVKANSTITLRLGVFANASMNAFIQGDGNLVGGGSRIVSDNAGFATTPGQVTKFEGWTSNNTSPPSAVPGVPNSARLNVATGGVLPADTVGSNAGLFRLADAVFTSGPNDTVTLLMASDFEGGSANSFLTYNLTELDGFLVNRTVTVNVLAPVPEPATVLAVGALGLAAASARRRRRAKRRTAQTGESPAV